MEKIVIFDWGGVIESHRAGEYDIRTAVMNLIKVEVYEIEINK